MTHTLYQPSHHGWSIKKCHSTPLDVTRPVLVPHCNKILIVGGLPMMSDSVFSLIILVYVSVAFCIVFFLFCWKASGGRGTGQPLDFKQQCPLMTNELQVRILIMARYSNGKSCLIVKWFNFQMSSEYRTECLVFKC